MKLSKETLKVTLNEHYSLLGILFGSLLLSTSLGPYINWDAQTEYAAALGVIKWGLPYITPGNLINQPPVGYYIDAFFFKIFGLSYETGVDVVALFGLGCIFLVYEVGKIFYGKRTGLVAAALFGLTPWYLVMSRAFLIDTQCLFLSLLYLLVGIWAIQRGSLKILFVSGILFGLALLTKAFAVYMLIPLSLTYSYLRPKNIRRAAKGIVLFLSPGLVLNYFWYEKVSRQGMFFILFHDDFSSYFPQGIVPSPFFLVNFLTKNLGMFFLGACILSLFLSLSQRKLFSKVLISDLLCIVPIICFAGLDAFLVLGRNLWIPCVALTKYAYPILPFFCWLAASLIGKCFLLPGWKNLSGKQRGLIYSVALAGLLLLIASVAVNMKSLNELAGWDYKLFSVEGNLGYSFNTVSQISRVKYSVAIQGLAFFSIALSVIWFNLGKLKSVGNRLYHLILKLHR